MELTQRCLAGDTVALREFVEMFERQVFALCLRMLNHRQDAEDAAQESLLRAVKYLDRWDDTKPLAPWVLKIAANRCRTALEKRSRTPAPSLAAEQVSQRATSRPLDLGEELQLALRELHAAQRNCFELFYDQELSIAEISDIMDVPSGTIKTWLHRSRKQLAEYLRGRGVTA